MMGPMPMFSPLPSSCSERFFVTGARREYRPAHSPHANVRVRSDPFCLLPSWATLVYRSLLLLVMAGCAVQPPGWSPSCSRRSFVKRDGRCVGSGFAAGSVRFAAPR